MADTASIELYLADTPELLARCLALRTAVFVREKGVPADIEQDALDNLEGTCTHFLFCRDGEDAGAVRCRPAADNAVQLQRFCILGTCRGTGLGRTALGALEDWYRHRGVAKIVLDAKFEAAGFYAACGYRQTSAVFMEAGVPHVKMEKAL